MRRITLTRAALAAVAISVPVAVAARTTEAAAAAETSAAAEVTETAGVAAARASQPESARKPESFNQKVATYVKRLEGSPYVYGGTTPAGFDCSGLTQYVYRHEGKRIARTAEEQFREFRRVSESRAWGGDLVFFHTSSDPDSYVYHVGVYEGGHGMVAAASPAQGVIAQSFSWAGDTVTFGTISH